MGSSTSPTPSRRPSTTRPWRGTPPRRPWRRSTRSSTAPTSSSPAEGPGGGTARTSTTSWRPSLAAPSAGSPWGAARGGVISHTTKERGTLFLFCPSCMMSCMFSTARHHHQPSEVVEQQRGLLLFLLNQPTKLVFVDRICKCFTLEKKKN